MAIWGEDGLLVLDIRDTVKLCKSLSFQNDQILTDIRIYDQYRRTLLHLLLYLLLYFSNLQQFYLLINLF